MLPDLKLPDSLTLARLETRWHAPWLIAGLSHWGQHHAEIGLPNQDAFASGSVGRTTWLALADGVSAAPRPGEGAAFVTRMIGDELERALALKGAVDEPALAKAIEATRRRLQAHAVRSKVPLATFATTLLVAVLSETSITLAKIGDGYVLALERHRDGSMLVPMVENPLQREAGEVIDLTHPSWRSHLRVRHIPDRIEAGIETVALGSDGCSRFFVRTENAHDDANRRAALNGELIDGQLTTNLQRLGARNLFAYLANLMGHRQFVDEGDDRTLLLATLAPATGLPCFPTTA